MRKVSPDQRQVIQGGAEAEQAKHERVEANLQR